MVSGKVTADHMLQGSTHMFLVTGQTQSFSGDKTFSDDVVVGGTLSVTGETTLSDTTTIATPGSDSILNIGASDDSSEHARLNFRANGTGKDTIILFFSDATSQFEVKCDTSSGSGGRLLFRETGSFLGFYLNGDDGRVQTSGNLICEADFRSDSLDTHTSGGTMSIGPSRASKVEIADTAVETEIQGTLDVHESATFQESTYVPKLELGAVVYSGTAVASGETLTYQTDTVAFPTFGSFTVDLTSSQSCIVRGVHITSTSSQIFFMFNEVSNYGILVRVTAKEIGATPALSGFTIRAEATLDGVLSWLVINPGEEDTSGHTVST